MAKKIRDKTPTYDTPQTWAAGLDAHLTEQVGDLGFSTTPPKPPAVVGYETKWKGMTKTVGPDLDRIQVALTDWYQMHPAPRSNG